MQIAEQMEALKTALADSAAISDIECNTLSDDELWHDLTPLIEEGADYIEDAVRYLTWRGLLELHPEQAHQVRIKR